MKDCICGHYKTNHERQRDTMRYDGKCRGESGCYGHVPCKCKEFRLTKEDERKVD